MKKLRQELMEALVGLDQIGQYAPARDRVLLFPLRHDDVHKQGSLYVPSQDDYWRALVVAVGPGTLLPKTGVRVPPGFESGDVVVVGSWVGEPLTVDGVDFRWAKAGDVLAVLDLDSEERDLLAEAVG